RQGLHSYPFKLEEWRVAWSRGHARDRENWPSVIERKLEPREERCHHDMGFGHGERRANANARTSTEGHERTVIGPRWGLACEAIRHESRRLTPELAVTMEHPRADPDQHAGSNRLAGDGVVGNGLPCDVGRGRIKSQRLKQCLADARPVD